MSGTHHGRLWRSGPFLAASLVLASGLGCLAGRPSLNDRPSARPLPPGRGEVDGTGAGGGCAGVPALVRRLTGAEYRRSVADLLGPDLVMPVLEDDTRAGGFSTTGAVLVGTSIYSVERYALAAEALAEQVFADAHRRTRLFGRACVPRTVLARLGRRAFRRPLSSAEVLRYEAVAHQVGGRWGDPWRGLQAAVAALLQSPSWLARTAWALHDPARPGLCRYTSHEIASRLSFFLWGTGPDQELLDAADGDLLVTEEGVRRQALRLLGAPRAREGLRAFFGELMRLQSIDHLSREMRHFTLMTRTLPAAMQEETLRVLEHNMFESRADFRSLLTTRQTFVNAELAVLYGLPPLDNDAGLAAGLAAGFAEAHLPAAGARAGLLGHAAFLAGNAGLEDTSPTARGKFVREVLLCEEVAPPPGTVDTHLPAAPGGRATTLRARLEEHRLDAGCARCHDRLDPVGFAFERFDAVGQERQRDNDLPIDDGGTLDGRVFAGAPALADLLSRDDRVPACLVRNLFRYATGRVGGAEEAAVAGIVPRFAASGYKVFDAVVALVASPAFRYAPAGAPEVAPP